MTLPYCFGSEFLMFDKLKPSPFMNTDTWIDQNDLAFAVLDGYPVSPGHTLVLPKRKAASFLNDLSSQERAACMSLVWTRWLVLKDAIDPSLGGPMGFNIGINDGIYAGQTIGHAHVHLIPRYAGDHPNPRGGVRAVIPGKATY